MIPLKKKKVIQLPICDTNRWEPKNKINNCPENWLSMGQFNRSG